MTSTHPAARVRGDLSRVEVVLCDLDGVVWLAHRPIPGAVDAIARLRASGRRVLFVTNNSSSVVGDVEADLGRLGIPATGDVLTSALAGATLVDPGDRVMVVGGAGIVEAVERRGATAVPPSVHPAGRADAVLVGIDREFSYVRLDAASRAIRAGARFIATNVDATYPTPHGPTPGGGSIVAAVATAAGQEPVVAGKPHRPMADLVEARCGEQFDADRTLMVGDRWSTDGAFAQTIGGPFALVRSGVTAPGAPVADIGGGRDVAVDIDAADLAAVADRVVAG